MRVINLKLTQIQVHLRSNGCVMHMEEKSLFYIYERLINALEYSA